MKKSRQRTSDELVKVTIEIRYPEVPTALDFRKKLLQAITGKIPKKTPPFKEGIVIDVKKKRMRVAVESNRTAIDLEGAADETIALGNVLVLFKRLNKTVGWGKIARLGVRTIWVEQTDKPMPKLIMRFKKKFYLKNSLLEKANDVAVFFTLEHEGSKVNYASGPIEKEELRTKYSIFSKITLPKRAVLVDVDYYTAKPFDFSLEYLSSFMEKALEYGKERYKETIKIL